jgi:phosphate-selective porin OprO and OprP
MRNIPMRHVARLFSLSSTVLLSLSLRAADENAPPSLTMEQRFQALEQEMKALKEQQALFENKVAAEREAAAKDAVKMTANAKDGFSISSADGAHKLKLGGAAQFETRFFLNDEEVPNTNSFFIRRVRPNLSGTVAKYFDFSLVLDFAGGSTPGLNDAFMIANLMPEFKIQMGRFKTPLGLEHIQSDSLAAFNERSFPTQLGTGRDAGVQVLGDIFAGTLNYQLGIFNGPSDRSDRDVDNGNDDDKEAIGRLYAAPFKNTEIALLKGLNFGVGASYGRTVASPLPTYVSPGNTQFFGYTEPGVSAHGTRVRYSPQLYYCAGPFDMMFEYISSRQEIQTTAADSRRSVANTAWHIEAGYVLTGENASFRGVVPAGGGIGSSGWGAFQLVVRVSELSLDEDIFSAAPVAFASRATSAESALHAGVVLNWWMNRNVRFMVNYDHTTFEAGGGGTNDAPEDKEDEHVIRTRVQLLF